MNAHLLAVSFPGAFAWLLRTTWQATFLAMLVLAAQWLLRGRLSARVRCLLWAIVLLRLLLPPLPQTRWTLFPAAAHPESASVARTEATPKEIAPTLPAVPIVSPPLIKIDPRLVLKLRAELAAVPEPLPTSAISASPYHPTTPARSWPTLNTTLQCLWLTGALFFAARILIANARLHRAIRRSSTLDDPNLQSLAARCATEAGLRQTPVLLAADHLVGPAVTGLLAPKLLIPRDMSADFSPPELRLMLLHEFAHLRRRDLQLSWLLSLLTAIHWFNPLLRWAFNRLRADCEMACDEFVLKLTRAASPQGQQSAYGHALLRVAERLTRRPSTFAPIALGQIGILDGPQNLHRRIVMIAHFNPTSATFSRAWPALAAGFLLLCGGVLLADATDPSKPSAVEEKRTATIPPPRAAATVPASKPALTLNSGGTISSAKLDELWRERANLDLNLRSATARLETLKQSLASGKEPPLIEQMIFQDGELQHLKMRDDNAQQQFDAYFDKLGPNHPIVLQLRKRTEESKAAVSKREAQCRNSVVRQLEEDLGNLFSKSTELDARLGGHLDDYDAILHDRIKRLDQAREVLEKDIETHRLAVHELEKQFGDNSPKLMVARDRLENAQSRIKEIDANTSGIQEDLSSMRKLKSSLKPKPTEIVIGKLNIDNGQVVVNDLPYPLRDVKGAITIGADSRHGSKLAAPLPSLADVQDADSRKIDDAAAEKLRKPQIADFTNVTMQAAIRTIADRAGLEVIFDDRELKRINESLDIPFTLNVKEPTSGSQLIRWVLSDNPPTSHTIDHGVLLISSRKKIDQMTTTRAYDVASLGASGASLPQLVQEVVAPDSWRESGGMGVARLFGNKLLVIQTSANHAEVEKLLALLAAKSRTSDVANPLGGLFNPIQKARDAASFQVSANNLRQILVAIAMFADQHEGKLPINLRDDLKPYLSNAAVFTNPRDPEKTDGYIYLHPMGKLSDLKVPSKTILMYEALEDEEGIAIGYADGHVERAKEYSKLIEKHEAPASRNAK